MSLELKNVIFDLSSADGVSGEESCAAQYALKYLKNYTDDCFITVSYTHLTLPTT